MEDQNMPQNDLDRNSDLDACTLRDDDRFPELFVRRFGVSPVRARLIVDLLTGGGAR
jgi:hypothetical protein